MMKDAQTLPNHNIRPNVHVEKVGDTQKHIRVADDGTHRLILQLTMKAKYLIMVQQSIISLHFYHYLHPISNFATIVLRIL